jgi:hypothetical protein
VTKRKIASVAVTAVCTVASRLTRDGEKKSAQKRWRRRRCVSISRKLRAAARETFLIIYWPARLSNKRLLLLFPLSLFRESISARYLFYQRCDCSKRVQLHGGTAETSSANAHDRTLPKLKQSSLLLVLREMLHHLHQEVCVHCGGLISSS